jgi:SAM-dependent methyltransferase
MIVATDSKERFSNRVADYVRYRPGYPVAVLDVLREKCGLAPESIVADIGSGTGILTQMLLGNRNLVYGVEPNAEMRGAAESLLQEYAWFRSVAASAEATTLPDAGVDLVVAGQAFHWFEPRAARSEFARILKPGGWVAVITNARLGGTTSIHREYEALIRKYGTDYANVSQSYTKYHQMKDFFCSASYGQETVPNVQVFDFDGLRGRLLSASYAPAMGHPNHEPMLAELRRVFDGCEDGGYVRFGYNTEIHYGQLEAQ